MHLTMFIAHPYVREVCDVQPLANLLRKQQPVSSATLSPPTLPYLELTLPLHSSCRLTSTCFGFKCCNVHFATAMHHLPSLIKCSPCPACSRWRGWTACCAREPSPPPCPPSSTPSTTSSTTHCTALYLFANRLAHRHTVSSIAT